MKGEVVLTVQFGWDSTRTYERVVAYSATWLVAGTIASVEVDYYVSGSGSEHATALVGRDGVHWLWTDRPSHRSTPRAADALGDALREALFGETKRDSDKEVEPA